MAYFNWQFTSWVAFFLYTLVHFAWQIQGTKINNIENMIEASKNQRITSLQCHVCHSETDPGCFNMTNNEFFGYPENCVGNQVVCMVKKFAYSTWTEGNGTTTPIKTFAIKRDCASRCEEGCVVMGERTRLYVCSQCCLTPLCNVGSGTASIHRLHFNGSFHHFLTSVANVQFFMEKFYKWQVLELISLLFIQLLLL